MDEFRTTRWSVVRAAQGEDSAARDALAALCETYWYPLYAFVRRSGQQADDARDLTQGFFARLLEKRDFGTADPERGRFRSYLLASMKHFLSNERDRARALKRGGGQPPIAIDATDAEGRYHLEPSHDLTPEKLYQRNWTLALLAATKQALHEEQCARGKSALFEVLEPALLGENDDTSRAERAMALGMTEDSVNVAIHRLRRRFRAKLREEVGHTLDCADRVDQELRELFAALED